MEWEDVFNRYDTQQLTREQRKKIKRLLFWNKNVRQELQSHRNMMELVRQMHLNYTTPGGLEGFYEIRHGKPHEYQIIIMRFKEYLRLVQYMHQWFIGDHWQEFFALNSTVLTPNELRILKTAMGNIQDYRNLYRVFQFSNRMHPD